MNVLLLLAPFSVLLGLLAVAAFVWTLRSGQYDDIQGSAERILIDDDDLAPGDRHDAPSPGDGARSTGELTPSTGPMKHGQA
jgi:cbb3-type cytochrome oxidase maturation protein